MRKIEVCPGNLIPGYDTFSPLCLKKLFDGKRVSPVLGFDFDADGNKIKQEDFSSLAQKTTDTHGKDYKYTGSYEDVAALLKANTSAWQVEMSHLFTLIV